MKEGQVDAGRLRGDREWIPTRSLPRNLLFLNWLRKATSSSATGTNDRKAGSWRRRAKSDDNAVLLIFADAEWAYGKLDDEGERGGAVGRREEGV